MYQWRKFEFFKEKYRGKSKIPEEITGEIKCCSSRIGKVAIGCDYGTVSFLDQGLKFNYGFQAYSSSVLFLQQLKILHVFTNQFPEAKITSLLVLEEAPPILLIAVGLDNGSIYCIKGDIACEQISRFKLQVDDTSGKSHSAITGLGFRVKGQALQLFRVACSALSTNHREDKPSIRLDNLYMHFLEKYTDEMKDSLGQVEIHNTLLELYLSNDLAFLSTSQSSDGDLIDKEKVPGPAEMSKALSSGKLTSNDKDHTIRCHKGLLLLKNAWPSGQDHPLYAVDLAIILCEVNLFREGLLFLYEKMKLYREVIACYMQTYDHEGLIACCKSLGDSDSCGDIFLLADLLKYFGSLEKIAPKK
ncbi:hypothetical protein Ancab_032401 [Ancistrocladus abbreviatus]